MLNAYEMADDPRAYRAERAAYERGRALVTLLVRATGAYVEPARAPLDDAPRKQRALAYWSDFVRERRYGFLGRPDWQPSAMQQHYLARCGVTMAEIEAELAERAHG
jgi:hypothetical protein